MKLGNIMIMIFVLDNIMEYRFMICTLICTLNFKYTNFIEQLIYYTSRRLDDVIIILLKRII